MLCGVVFLPNSRPVIPSNCPPVMRSLVEQCWEDTWQTRYHFFYHWYILYSYF